MKNSSYIVLVNNLLAFIFCFGSSFFHAQVSFSGCYISGALVDPGSTAGCGNSGTNNYCNLASLYVPAFTPTACSTFTSSGGVSHVKGTVYTLPAGCTATIEAEFRKRNYLGVGATGTGCSNCGMDGSPDGLTIVQSGGTIISQFSQMAVNVGTCGAYPVLGTYTTAVSTISPGCNNADGYVNMILSGGTFTVGGTSNRADEVITYTINLSGTCGSGCSNVLPIELLVFSGSPVQDKVNLNWRVATEQNVDYYLIERSMDASNWNEVIKILSKSATQGTNLSYFAQDYYPQEGINYYRLTNYDKNGDIGPSRVIAVNYSRESFPFWTQQNSEEIILNFNLARNHADIVQLYDVSGRLAYEVSIEPGNTRKVIPKQHLAKGVYFIKAVIMDNTEFVKLIIH